MTLEKLAEITQAGFRELKQDLTQEMDKRFAEVDERFAEVDEHHKLLVEGIDTIRADVHDMKITLGPLVRAVTAVEDDVRGLDLRLKRVEKKVGITR